MKTNELMTELCRAMRDEYGAGDGFEVELGELIGKYRRKHDRAMIDAETARLLPLGAEIAAERKHCHRSTVYRRASRAKSVARLLPLATTPA
jgi:hypothetical protein